jgi:hypothetical protein
MNHTMRVPEMYSTVFGKAALACALPDEIFGQDGKIEQRLHSHVQERFQAELLTA